MTNDEPCNPHLPLDLTQVGYGFGQLDYFCGRCQKRLKSVKLEDLNPEERAAVAAMVSFIPLGEQQ